MTYIAHLSPRLDRTLPALIALLAVAPLWLALLEWPFRLALLPDAAAGVATPIERPTTIRHPAGVWAMLTLVAWFVLAYRSRRIARWEWPLVLAAALIGLLRLGNVWLTALMLVLPLSRQIALARPSRTAALASILALALPCVLIFTSTRPDALPVAFTRVLAAQSGGGRAMAPISMAGAAHAALPPTWHVYGALDPTEPPGAYWEDVLRVSRAHAAWPSLLDAYGVDLLLFDARADPALRAAISTEPTWQVEAVHGGYWVARRGAP